MPPTPRRPTTPTGRLRLSPIRPRGSVQLDSGLLPVKRGEEPGDPIGQLVPFRPWGEFLDEFTRTFKQGEHITLVGRNGSGKTVLARHLITIRDYVVVFATKQRDPSLYEPLEDIGFQIVPEFSEPAETPSENPYLILRPPLPRPDRASIKAQAVEFAKALTEIWVAGEWCIFADEVRYLTDNLKLAEEFETLWLQGRSMGISIVAGTQRPVSIPREAFSQARHFFFFAEYERDNIIRMSEFVGRNQDVVRHIIPLLPEHEALYINNVSGRMYRTKVTL